MDEDQLARVADGRDQEFAQRPLAARQLLQVAQRPLQSPHGQGVGPAQRTGQQVLCDDLVEESLLQGGPQQEKERTDGGLTDQRDLVARDDHRNTGLGQRPAQHRNLPHGAPHEHRHP